MSESRSVEELSSSGHNREKYICEVVHQGWGRQMRRPGGPQKRHKLVIDTLV